MTKAVFDVRPGSGYDDEVVRRYHFPRQYLAAALAAVGDWVVYREPRRGGGRAGYVAVARVRSVEPDPARVGHSYAHMSDYLPFDRPVPLDGPVGAYEAILRGVAGADRGRTLQGRSVRALVEKDFVAIVHAGLAETLDPANAVRLGLAGAEVDDETAYLVQLPELEHERRIEALLVNRRIRNAAFRRSVLDAYEDRCAVTGLRMVNGGGRAEAQAAHILPVADGGPDVVQNGIALSATAHWLFDRHLISLTDDLALLVSHNKVPAALRSLFARQMQLVHLPSDRRLWPRPEFVARHRAIFASG
ncbi:HNH endonuclease (plasmid) [Roseomonas sp. OT10]|uniref:HNH endonuclease n=1 Tax=Roseomonas cutis TaxID=2897332 RepID=UPI001E2B4E76|nr:HNH endonuclease [Roseomonas sp. OT10]UFN51599.1 HNH endonuclease [Roseomonas sp. OT10]